MRFALEVLMLIASLFAFTYGAKISFKKGGVLFLQIVTCAMGCMCLGQCYYVVYLLTFGNSPIGFNIGLFGIIGMYFFLYSASFGAMDSLGDNGSKEFTKYRIISLVAPFFVVGLMILIVLSNIETGERVGNIITGIPIAFTSYFALKHLIIPDVDLGILKVMRGYNVLILGFALINIISITLISFDILYAKEITNILNIIIISAIVPIANGGVKRWFI